MTMKHGIALAILCSAAFSTAASAQISEVRVGIAKHDLRVIGDIPQLEPSVALQGEILFEEPEFLKWALSPQPYIAGTLNLAKETSYGGAGLLWRQNFGARFYGDFAFGLVVHDGTRRLDINLETILNDAGVSIDDVTPANAQAVFDQAFDERSFQRLNTIQYGSRVLFREQLTLGYRVDEDWAVEGFFEHISHGGLLSDGPNFGSDAGGFRVAKRF